MKKMHQSIVLLAMAAIVVMGVCLAGCTTAPEQSGTSPTAEPTAAAGPKEKLLLATTTSLYDTGLLDHLKPMFEEMYNVDLLITSQGTGKAIEIASRGDADVLAVHSPSQEKAFMDAGHGMNRRCFAYNYFIIVGPEDDPAGIKGMEPEAAFQKLYELGQAETPGVLFASRGDNSGTHSKEKAIWAAAGFDYATEIQKSGPWYIEAGRGMGETLQLSNEKDAYTLSDEGTYLAYKGDLALVPLIDEGDILLNIYSVITVYNENFAPEEISMANNFVDFLISQDVQDEIGSFGVDKYGKNLFSPINRECTQFNCDCSSPAAETTPAAA
ncbi:MAG TPA: substrate-binding domain-containing protein [Methanoregulaceae archaeon]|nr:substrate-binding domain-containing protein [Methanoregulaceae archaeon]